VTKSKELEHLESIEETGATGSIDGLSHIQHTDAGVATSFPDDAIHPQFKKPGQFLAKVVLISALSGSGAFGFTPTFVRRREDGQLIAEASTAETECDPRLLRQIRDLFDQGASEFFQDGIQSHFSRSLLTLLAIHGREAVRAIAKYVSGGRARADVLSEALRHVGDFPDAASAGDRWALLRSALKHRSSRVRDGAILGFAAMDDPEARDVLTEARNVEQVAELRRLIDVVIAQLERRR